MLDHCPNHTLEGGPPVHLSISAPWCLTQSLLSWWPLSTQLEDEMTWGPSQFQSNKTEWRASNIFTVLSPDVVEFCCYLNKSTVRKSTDLTGLKETIPIWRKSKRWLYHNQPHLTRAFQVPGTKDRENVAGTLLATGSMGSHSTGTVLLDMAHCGQAGVIAHQFSCGGENPSPMPQKQKNP